MSRSKAEDAGGLAPVKDDNEAAAHFTPWAGLWPA